MADTTAIENATIADVVSVLSAVAGAGTVQSALAERPQAATFTLVRCLNVADALRDSRLPSGVYRATMVAECWSYRDDDKTGAALLTLAGVIRGGMWMTDILTRLTAASTACTYAAFLPADSFADEEDRYRIRAIPFDLIVHGSK